jgi:hypothetical protein
VIQITEAPEWIIKKCGVPYAKAPKTEFEGTGSFTAAIDYLENDAPLAIENAAGDETTFKVACRIMDYGISLQDAVSLLAKHWNERCQPPWGLDELETKCRNAFEYRNKPVGDALPETQFDEIATSSDEKVTSNPIQELNKEYAFTIAGNSHHILWETVDMDGEFSLMHLSEASFHKALISRTMMTGGDKPKIVPMTKLWMESKNRRSYKGICFRPEKETPADWYNLWRGFKYEPATDKPKGADKKALNMFIDHTLNNVCNGNRGLFEWVMGYFAHMIQKPWEKPLVALVFKGAKGVGKNALIERIGALLGHHFLVSSNRRYLVGNFNGHMENMLLFTLDEAFWSGDKQAEGQLKDLITGRHHVIEHKGQEPYKVDNLTRVCIIGNEDWLVPATADERRFAVLEVGEGRKQDKNYFYEMRVLMEKGGYPYLLKYLQDFDISNIDVNQAPDTEALADQKLASLTPVQRWWFECLRNERVMGGDFGGAWPEEISTEAAREAMERYSRNSRIKTWAPDSRQFGKELSRMAPSLTKTRKKGPDGDRMYFYALQTIEQLREEFEKYLGHKNNWSEV